jgi:hypothetical protein
MAKLFAPYVGKKPAPVVINGHRLLIVSPERALFDENLNIFGGDRIKSLPTIRSQEEQERMLVKLAKRSDAGIVVAPGEVSINDLLQSLRNELPWVH